jgi:energy-coupling factor transporter ATP-binding protein EcfA2
MINLEHIKNYLGQNDDTDPELKKEHELNNNDRMFLINRKIDENFVLEIYDNLIERKKYIKDESIVDVNDYVFNDVEFLHDHYLDDSKGIFQKLDKCNTKMGSLILKNIFLKPIHDVSILKKRQIIFQKISKIKNRIDPILKEVKILEHDLLWFWNDSNLKHIDLMNDLIYFNYDIIPFFNMNEVLNNSERALLITNIYKIAVAPLLTILTPLISLLLPLIFLFYMQRKANLNISMGAIFKQYIKTLFGSDSMSFIFKNPSKAMLASLVTKGIYLFMYFQNIYYSFQSSSNTHKVINIIHEKLNKINKYIKLTGQIKEQCESVGINNIESYINYNRVGDDLSIYDEYFNFPVFNTDPKLLSNKGKILTVFKKFKKNKDNLVNIFHYSGAIDAILSVESIIANSSPENPYSITKFSDSKKPILDFKNIWHPYLNKDTIDNAVKNSIHIKNNILITGPNAAGKSTFIKSVIINIILSQTIGISSAEEFIMTPFNNIETYLHIPDSKGSSSLFEAEMFRSKEYIDKLKTLDQDKFSFIVLDEIFSSTNYVEGFSGAYSILKKISSFKNTLSITTTHYTDLEILEKDTKGKILNYKFEVDHDENGEIVFNYILKRGMSRQYIALELLKKNGFDEDVIDDAMNMCSKIKSNKLIFFEDKDSKKEKKDNIKRVKKVKKNNKSIE